MFKSTIILFALLAATFAYPLDNAPLVEDLNGQQYYLVPVESEPVFHRQRRQVSGGINDKGFDLSGTGHLLNNNRHQLDGTATVAKQFGGGPWSKGGGLDYTHKPSGSGASVSALHTPGWGTDVNAAARYNFFRSDNGRTTAGLSGNYDRHFGGPIGTQKPNYGAFLNFNHRF